MLSWNSFYQYSKQPLAAFTHIHCRDSSERGINSVAMAIISPRTEYCPNPGIKLATSCFHVLYTDNGATGALVKDIIDPFPNKPWFLRVCCTSRLKTLWEKEKLLLTSNFSFSHNVFYPFQEPSTILIKFEIVVCKLF